MRIYIFTPLLSPLTLVSSKGLVSRALLSRACSQPVSFCHCLRHGFPYLCVRLYFHQYTPALIQPLSHESASSVFVSICVSFSESVIFRMSSSCRFKIRFRNNQKNLPCNGFVYKSTIIISVGQYSTFISFAGMRSVTKK